MADDEERVGAEDGSIVSTEQATSEFLIAQNVRRITENLLGSVLQKNEVDTKPDSEVSEEAFITGITDELLLRVEKAVYEIERNPAGRPTITMTQDILEAILEATESKIAMKETYALKCQSHNQYNLFNLMDVIHRFNIDDDMYDTLCFRECLIINRLDLIVDDQSTELRYTMVPVGGLCIDVQKAEGKQPQQRLLEQYEQKLLQTLDEEGICNHVPSTDSLSESHVSEDSLDKQNEYAYSKFMVHVSSHLDVDDSQGGSTITAFVDRNLHTIEELRKEFIVDEQNDVNEKALYAGMKKAFYYMKHTSSQTTEHDRRLYSMKKMRDFVSEGANFVLMRYIAVNRYFGIFELACCYINGDLCRNIYECFGPESDIFNGVRLDCCRIKRTILEECGLEHVSITVLSLNGLILKHEWEGSDYIFTINPKQKINTDTKPSCLDELTMDDCWTEDLQLLSKYLDMKNIGMLEAKTYMVDHPELRHLLADYVNEILQLRPSDIKDFTFKYFGNYVATSTLPRNDYFE